MEIIWPVEKMVERRSNGDGHHGEMCFDIALHYHATIKVNNTNKTTQNP